MISFKDVTYKIVGFDLATGVLSVFYTGMDRISYIDLHLTPEGKYPEGRELDEYIRMMCPLHVINRRLAIEQGEIPNAGNILSLIQEMPPELANNNNTDTPNSDDLFDVLR